VKGRLPAAQRSYLLRGRGGRTYVDRNTPRGLEAVAGVAAGPSQSAGACRTRSQPEFALDREQGRAAVERPEGFGSRMKQGIGARLLRPGPPPDESITAAAVGRQWMLDIVVRRVVGPPRQASSDSARHSHNRLIFWTHEATSLCEMLDHALREWQN
jgi:hypothetical protein